MKNDLKSRLLASVISGKEPDRVYFGEHPRRRWSMVGAISAALAASGLLMLLLEKVKPLF